MNRFDPMSMGADLLEPVREESQVSPPTPHFGPKIPHALFTPLHYEPRYGYPLLVWLHGPGDDQRQLQRVMPHISVRNYAAIGPRGVCQPQSSPGCHWRQSAEAIDRAQQRVWDCIGIAEQKFNINPRRIFIGGFQCGGTMALRLAWRHPERFAGAVSLGGAFPEGRTPMARLDALRGLPLLIARGSDSTEFSTETVCRNLRMSHAAGIRLDLREYPCADDLLTNMLSDLNTWMMEQVTGGAKSAEFACRRQA